MYIYQADVWCDDCGRAIRKRLDRAGKTPKSDEHTYDSDDYPKHADECESDVPDHCAAGEKCLNAIILPSGGKVGMLMGELTQAGVEYVKDSLAEAQDGMGSLEVVELWVRYFRDKGYDL